MSLSTQRCNKNNPPYFRIIKGLLAVENQIKQPLKSKIMDLLRVNLRLCRGCLCLNNKKQIMKVLPDFD